MSCSSERSKPIHRRTVLKGFAGVAGLIAAPVIVRAQGILKYGTPIIAGLNGKPGDPTFESIARISTILKEKYDTVIDLQVHPSSTLGTDLSQLEAVRTGFIGITSNATGAFAQSSPAFVFCDLPYIITNWDMAARLFKSEVWRTQAKKFEADTGLFVLPPVGGGGFRLLLNNKRPLQSPVDSKGLKIRSTTAPSDIALMKAWGLNPTPLAWSETYNSLRNGLVEGMHVQPVWTLNFNMHEVLKFATEAGATFAVQLQVMSKPVLDAMPEQVRERFLKAAQEAADEANGVDRRDESVSLKKLQERGIQLYTPTAPEMKDWRERGEALWGSLGKNTDKATLDAMVALR